VDATECTLLLLLLMMSAIASTTLRVLPDAKASYAAGAYIEAELFMHYCVDISVPCFDILPVPNNKYDDIWFIRCGILY
jgi:hypothetical protein